MIAVCIPAYNLLEYTRWAIEAVLRHSAGHDAHLYLLDNGSSGRATFDFMKSVPGAKVVRNEENRWVYGGWNQLLSMALEDKPDIVTLMSNDVRVGPGWLDGVAREFSKDRNRYFLPNTTTLIDGFDEFVQATLKAKLYHGATVPGRAGWCMSFPAEAVPIFLPIPVSLRLWYGDDWIHWKLKAAGYKCETILDSFALHFGSKTLEAMNQDEKVRIIAQDKAEYERLTGEKM